MALHRSRVARARAAPSGIIDRALSRSAVAAAIALACGGCAGSSITALRAHGERGATIVAQHVSGRLKPATGFVLVNPLEACDIPGCYTDVCGAVALACMSAVGAIDLLAVPVQVVRRSAEGHDLARIRKACPVEDPASRAAGLLGAIMVRDFGFTPAPSGPPTVPAGAVVLEVRTTRFARSSQITWEGRVAFRDANGDVLWQDACVRNAPIRKTDTFEVQCEAARAEVAALADECVEKIAWLLRIAWEAEAKRSRQEQRAPGADAQAEAPP